MVVILFCLLGFYFFAQHLVVWKLLNLKQLDILHKNLNWSFFLKNSRNSGSSTEAEMPPGTGDRN
jgi:hypothetical protein